MNSPKDKTRLDEFIQNQGVIIPCGKDHVPVSSEKDQGFTYWIAFESRDWGLQSQAVNLGLYDWGQLTGLEVLKFIAGKVCEGEKQVLLVNPGTEAQMALEESVIQTGSGIL